MRATKAYIASLGTTGLLLAFSASLLLLVGTLFAFNAWPGAQIRDAVDSVLVDDGDDSARVAGPEQVALDASSAALAVTSTPGASTTPGSGGTGFGGTGGDGTTGSGTTGGGFVGDGGGGGQTPTGGVTPPATSGPGLPTSPQVDTSPGTNQLADNTQQLTNNLGNTVGQVSPNLGNTVTETGQALSDIVRDLPDVQVGPGGVKIGH